MPLKDEEKYSKVIEETTQKVNEGIEKIRNMSQEEFDDMMIGIHKELGLPGLYYAPSRHGRKKVEEENK